MYSSRRCRGSRFAWRRRPASLMWRFVLCRFLAGWDRDGNPYVDAGTTLRVARRLRLTLLRCYRRAFRLLRRRITFKGLDIELDALQSKVEEAILAIDSQVFDDEGVLEGLEAIEARVRQDFGGLHAEDIARCVLRF